MTENEEWQPSRNAFGQAEGTVLWDDREYTVVQIDNDTAIIRYEGEDYMEFASAGFGGFEDFDDVLNQAWDLLIDQGLDLRALEEDE